MSLVEEKRKSSSADWLTHAVSAEMLLMRSVLRVPPSSIGGAAAK